MFKSKRLSVLLLPLLMLTSCGSSDYNKCVDHVKTHLKSPSSYNCLSAQGYKNEDLVAFRIRYEADNSFGVPIADIVYVVISPDDVECSICEVLPNYCASIYAISAVGGEEIYSE